MGQSLNGTSALNLIGNTVWSGQIDIRVTLMSSVNNYGTFDVQNGQILSPVPGNNPGAFNNFGVFEKTGGNLTTVGTSFLNAMGGSFLLNGWGMNLSLGGKQTGAQSVTDLGNGTLSLGANNASYEAVAGTVIGGGTVFGNLTIDPNAFLNLGSGVSVLVVTGDYTQQNGATLTIQIAAANQYDNILVNGTANVAGGVVSVSLLGNYVPPANQLFEFLDFGQLNGQFANNPNWGFVYNQTNVQLKS